MTKKSVKNLVVMVMLLVVATAPASLAFAQSGFDSDTEDDDDQEKRSDAKERKDAIKGVHEEFKQQKNALKEQMRQELKQLKADQRNTAKKIDLTFNGTTSGWAIVNNTAHPSSIKLSGEAYSLRAPLWKINATGTLQIADRDVALNLKGHAVNNMINLQGSGTLASGESVRIHLKGHFAPTGIDDEFAVAFTNASVHYLQSGVRIPLMQVGSVHVVPVETPAVEPDVLNAQ